jgi:hypothetical protein
MKALRRIGTIPWVQKSAGVLAAEYLRLVRKTCSFAVDPTDIYDRLAPDLPVIFTMWHGQHFMTPFFRRGYKVKSLISRHRDGEINAIAAERLGIETIRGSGSNSRDFHRKGGFTAFRAMLEALAQGHCVAFTADVPKVSRIAGRGIVQLARASGRPIYPVAPATSRRIQLDSWDRAAINLPFGRFAIAVGAPIRVAWDADEMTLESARRMVEAELNATTERAYAIVDSRAKDFDWSRRRTSVSPSAGRIPASSPD